MCVSLNELIFISAKQNKLFLLLSMERRVWLLDEAPRDGFDGGEASSSVELI